MPSFANLSIISVRHVLDHFVHARKFGGLNDIRVFGFAEAGDVLCDGAGE